MGILEIHFHDSELSWSVNPGTDSERSISLGTGSRSGSERSGGATSPSLAPKLRSLAVLGLVVGAGIAFNRLRSRRAREEAEREPRGRLSLLRPR